MEENKCTQICLEVHQEPSAKAGLHLSNHVLGVAIKNIKMTDPITSEERTGHGTMKFPHVGRRIGNTVRSKMARIIPYHQS